MFAPFTRLPLSIRVPLLAAALMVLAGIVASQQVLATLGRVQNDRVRELAGLHIEALSIALGPHVLRDDIWEIYDTLDRAAARSARGRAVFTAVSDPTGRVLAATDPGRAPVDSRIDDIAEEARDLKDLDVAGGEEIILLNSPLIFQDRIVGRIVAELDVSDLVQERIKVSRLLLLWNAGATAILAVLGYLAMRRMMVPITQLASRMSETVDAPEPIPEEEMPGGDTEFARLARTYNAMASAVWEKAETERRLAERERFVSLGRLSSSLAHEINNPLGGLLNATDTIRQYADRPDVVRNSADLLSRGLKHLRDVARVTLEQKRIDRSGTPASLEDIEDLKLLISPEIRRHAQDISWEITAGNETLAQFPSASLRQILLNLLLNATAAAGPSGQVGLHIDEADRGVKISVSDTGAGLSEAAKMRLLTSEPVPPGGGVGLRMIRDLVEEMSGTVAARRSDNRTVIEIVLPFGERPEG